MKVQKVTNFVVQWSSGYDFCLTPVRNTEGLQFDPGLDHFLSFFRYKRKLKPRNFLTCNTYRILLGEMI